MLASNDFFASKMALECERLGSEIRKMYQQGIDLKQKNPEMELIDLSLGNPDLEPPEELMKNWVELSKILPKGAHRYMDNAGLPEIRSFLAQRFATEFQTTFDFQQVYLTCGAAGALQILLRSFLDPGDEALICAPYFSEYIPYVHSCQAKKVIVGCDSHLLPDLESLERQIGPKTKMLILNSPNNPSGVVYPSKTVEKIAKILIKANQNRSIPIHLVSDEPYARLCFKGVEFASPLLHYPYTWVVRSHSKDLGLAGERIGYFAWGPAWAPYQPLPIFRTISRTYGFVNAPSFMQYLLPRVFDFSVPTQIYENRVAMFCDGLEKLGFSVQRPGAGFFVFPQVPRGLDAVQYCSKLLALGLITVPGTSFGMENHFRLSLTQNESKLKNALNVIKSSIQNAIET